MLIEWELVREVRTENNYIFYKFKHLKEKTEAYYRVTIGDGFVGSEEIDREEFNNTI